ncbi:hypothetical protein ACYPKM_05110 [Pseudomonas aeruginosa]
MIILDTNAIIGLSASEVAILTNANSLHSCGVPTLVLLELSSHLEDVDSKSKDENFKYYRRQLLKTLNLGILDDPFAVYAKSVGRGFNPSRASDAPALKGFVEFLATADTLNAYRKFRLVLSDNEQGNVHDFAIRAERELKIFEDEHKVKFAKFMDSVREEFSAMNYEISEQVFMDFMSGATRSVSKEDKAKEFSALAYYYGYQIYRAHKYIQTKMNYQRNDAEDLAMCLHLNACTSDIMVTNDKGTREAVNSTTKLLNRFAEQISEEFGADLIPVKCHSLDRLRTELVTPAEA